MTHKSITCHDWPQLFLENIGQCQISDSQSRTRASQQRALSSIYNSEQVGVAAAQELIEQGEKLSRAELKLEEISELQKKSEKKINTLSSVFGGFENVFSRSITIFKVMIPIKYLKSDSLWPSSSP
ncbi:hypothetical protein MN116_000754 [Schistosoma mekongi]|uniref:Uncharacterized protein n=1 Tax=Schistosoma mekongi TaxID=38744 RepID=A0AAE1ZKM9_SCHME|nr:hypothetical protein MN116_000754 [Schistosoma mekongi]